MMMPSFLFIFFLAYLVTAAEEYKSQTTYPESAPPTTTPSPPPPPPPPKPAPYVEQSAQPPQPAATPAPYPQQAVPAPAPPPPPPAPYPQQAPPATPAPYPQHAVPAPASAPAPYHQQPPPPPPPHYPAPQTVYIQQAPPPPPAPHPAPHPAYIEHSAPRPAYIEHSAPQPQYLQQQAPYPQQAPPQYPQQQQHAYNAGPRTHHEEQPYPAKFQYVDYSPATTRRPYPYPSFEVLPHHEEYHPSSTTRRPITTGKPTTQKPRPAWGDTEYNYPERSLPLKGCFYNNHGYACCNLRLQTKMEELADELLNNGTFHRCNVQKLANDLQDKVETTFKEEFETVVGLSDFAERIHFREHYVCKIEVAGRYMLAWATPDDHSGARRKRGANATADEIHEYNF